MPKSQPNIRYRTGRLGESLALKFLTQKGYKPITQNFHIWGGEIDLIMEKDGDLIFIEVKTRKNDKFGRAEETLTRKQKLKLIRAIYQYLSTNSYQKSWRLDLIAINFTSASHAEIRHIKNILEE